MLFTSVDFLLFLPVVWGLYAVTPRRVHRPLLLVASYVFYMSWGPLYGTLLAATTLLNWASGVLIAREWRPRATMLVTVMLNLSILAWYKYLGFLMHNLGGLIGAAGFDATWFEGDFSVVLPLGVSFFTFQGIAYTLDVYRDRKSYVPSALDFFLFKAWFPQLIAGPIVRASELVHQFDHLELPGRARFFDGAALAMRGFFKKAAIADNLGLVVDQAFSVHTQWDTTGAWIYLFAYAFQIYFDFSGYTDIARGVSRCFGIELPVNFLNPYASSNITVFWRRWHITLSSWLRDYLYISLGGNRVGRVRQYRNLMLTMLLGGLWHGASWNFVLWGGWHGGLLALHKLLRATVPRRVSQRLDESVVWRGVATAGTFLLVVLSWVPFRAQTFAQTTDILRTMLVDLRFGAVPAEVPPSTAVLALAVYAVYRAARSGLARQPRLAAAVARMAANPSFAAAVLVHVGLVTFALSVDGASPFIYFQF